MDSSAAKKEAKSKKTAPARLLELSRHADPSVQLAVAKNPNTPVAALEYLSGHGKLTILKAVAGNPSTPPAILERLALHKQHTVCEVVASNLRTPLATLERLAVHPKGTIRKALTSNRALALAILETLSRDADESVRYGVAGNHQCSPVLLEQLALDESTDVRSVVAVSYNTPLEVVRKLAHDPEALVRGRTVYRLVKDRQEDLLERLLFDESHDVRVELTVHAESMSAQLASDPDDDIRERIARRNDLDTATLKQLLKDPRARVRRTLAHNKTTPTPIFMLEALCADPDRHVRWQVANNNAVTPAILERLAEDQNENVRTLARSKLEEL